MMDDPESGPIRTALIDLHLFPSIAYLLALCLADQVIFEAHEHFQKSSFRNRYHIGSVHGPLRLSVPLLKGKHQQMPIQDVLVDDRQNWRQIHWRSIQTAYGKSPFFDFYMDELYDSFQSKEPHLFAWSLDNIGMILRWLGLDIDWSCSGQYHRYDDGEISDLRNAILPDGKDRFSHWAASLNYEQVFASKLGFQQNLSILDMVFCLGPEAGARIKSFIRAQKIRLD